MSKQLIMYGEPTANKVKDSLQRHPSSKNETMARPARMPDAEAICQLVNFYAERGLMLHRSLESIYESLRDFLVAFDGDRLIGCIALSLSWEGLGEIRSLAVADGHQNKGVGRALVREAIEQAKSLCLKRIFVLTYEQAFFAKLSFRIVDKQTLPAKVWRDCIHCPKAEACDEIAMLLDLNRPPQTS